jgi:hypothetical protein
MKKPQTIERKEWAMAGYPTIKREFADIQMKIQPKMCSNPKGETREMPDDCDAGMEEEHL